MKKEFNEYLRSIDISGALLTRVEEIHNYYSSYLGFEINEIFVSEYITEDGSRAYENLWFFNLTHCFEAKQFVTMDDLDVDFYRGEIHSINIVKRDFNIIENTNTDNSRLNLTFLFGANRAGNLKASKSNCLQLSKILKTFLQPNLKK
jgi:hypothetical protein